MIVDFSLFENQADLGANAPGNSRVFSEMVLVLPRAVWLGLVDLLMLRGFSMVIVLRGSIVS